MVGKGAVVRVVTVVAVFVVAVFVVGNVVTVVTVVAVVMVMVVVVIGQAPSPGLQSVGPTHCFPFANGVVITV